MKTLNHTLTLAITTLCFLLAATMAKADSISINLISATQSGNGGDILSFDATVTNTSGATVYFNGDNTFAQTPLTLDDSPFLNNYPLLLDPGNSYTGVLFNVDLPALIPSGSYSGYFDITGGTTATSSDIVGTAEFQVTVGAATIPEPSSLLLLGTGAFGLLGIAQTRIATRRNPLQSRR